ncbi:hypothetical protein FUA48_11540 [Flavobacterium alkalisoli]|uniref:Lipoprotein n=1 Tax=Flavobacterium alkalisoli TaxID=2602769 RepID=A0A5B9FW02_9FLAO|nr:hypothetical protein [Flavobacterium alkalisoli]QEE50186.1 hypothetical protein FUA48_11540 [Flavobacterium alkalisoli]
MNLRIDKNLRLLSVFVGVLFISISGCNNTKVSEDNEKINEIKFADTIFKETVDLFIKDIEDYQVEPTKSIIVELYINQNSDTIISLTSFEPYETVDLVGINTYKNYRLYFYSTAELKPTLNEFLDLRNSHLHKVVLEPVEGWLIDPYFQSTYHVRNNKIITSKK